MFLIRLYREIYCDDVPDEPYSMSAQFIRDTFLPIPPFEGLALDFIDKWRFTISGIHIEIEDGEETGELWCGVDECDYNRFKTKEAYEAEIVLMQKHGWINMCDDYPCGTFNCSNAG